MAVNTVILGTFLIISVFQIGHVTCSSRFYRSDDPSANAAVLANMANRLSFLEAELAAQKQKSALLEGQLATQEQKFKQLEDGMAKRKVAFTAQMAEGAIVTVGNGGVLPFNKVTLNLGNAFDPNIFAFTAPYNGTYWFYVRVDEVGFRSMEIRVNSGLINRCDNDNGMAAITCGVVAILRAGDTVAVHHQEFGQAGGHIDPGPETYFTGLLVY